MLFRSQELALFNKTQQKVTEEELRVFATDAAVTSKIADYPLTYGEPGNSMILFIETYMQIWHEGQAIASPLQLAAMRHAQEDKRNDTLLNTAAADLTIMAKARALAIAYVLGEKIAHDIPQSAENEGQPDQLTAQDLEQVNIYAEA